MKTVSPAPIVALSPARLATRPWPLVTCRIWPAPCVCQCVRAPGAKNTLLIRTSPVPSSTGSAQTSPVNVPDLSSDLPPASRPRLIFIPLLPPRAAGRRRRGRRARPRRGSRSGRRTPARAVEDVEQRAKVESGLASRDHHLRGRGEADAIEEVVQELRRVPRAGRAEVVDARAEGLQQRAHSLERLLRAAGHDRQRPLLGRRGAARDPR